MASLTTYAECSENIITNGWDEEVKVSKSQPKRAILLKSWKGASIEVDFCVSTVLFPSALLWHHLSLPREKSISTIEWKKKSRLRERLPQAQHSKTEWKLLSGYKNIG